MKKQPDKFERMIMDMGDPPFEGVEVYAQFRQYHREVVEMVKQQRVVPEQGDSWDNGYNEAVEDLLVELEELAK